MTEWEKSKREIYYLFKFLLLLEEVISFFLLLIYVMQVLAKKFGAAIVSLEHRYYGKSSPFKSLTTNNLRYLSSKQALFDLAVFRQYYQVIINPIYNYIIN